MFGVGNVGYVTMATADDPQSVNSLLGVQRGGVHLVMKAPAAQPEEHTDRVKLGARFLFNTRVTGRSAEQLSS